jgi:hypothetical protein
MSDPQAGHVRHLSLIRLSSWVPEAFPDMSGPHPGHVRPHPISQRLSPGPDISGPHAMFQRGWSDMSDPRPGHVRLSDTPTARFSWGAIKGSHASLAQLGHSIHIANTLRHSIGLPTSVLQDSFKSNIPRRDLSLTLE